MMKLKLPDYVSPCDVMSLLPKEVRKKAKVIGQVIDIPMTLDLQTRNDIRYLVDSLRPMKAVEELFSRWYFLKRVAWVVGTFMACTLLYLALNWRKF